MKTVRSKALLRTFGGYWPGGNATEPHPPELTPAAKRRAASVIEELAKAGVTVNLTQGGEVRFHSHAIAPPAARRAMEVHNDLIQAFLVEQAIAALKCKQEM